MPLDIAGFRLSSPHSSRQEGSRIHMDKKTTEMLLNQPTIDSVSRVEERRDGRRSKGVAVAGGFRPHAGASISTVTPFPLPAHRTGRALLTHPALGRDHTRAHGKLAVRGPRRVSSHSFQSRLSGKRTVFPALTLCLRLSHWRSRRVACRSIVA